MEITSKIEGIGPKRGRELAKAEIKRLSDLRHMDVNRIYEKTGISKKRLAKWQSMALLQQIGGIDHQVSEALFVGEITNLQKLVEEEPKRILRVIRDAREPREARNIIPDTYERVITLEDVKEWQREARGVISPLPPVPSVEDMYEWVKIFFDSSENVLPTRFMFRSSELDDYLVYEYWFYYPEDYSPWGVGSHKHDVEGFYIFFDKRSHKTSLIAITNHWELWLQSNPEKPTELYVERGKHALYFEKKSGLVSRADGKKKVNIPWTDFVPIESEKTFLNNIPNDAEKWRVTPLINNPNIYKKILKEAQKGNEVVHVPADCKTHKKCVEWEKEKKCVKWKTKSEKKCAEYKDKGYKKCDKWVWFLSWLCKSWVWISNIVCVAWKWITYSVCKAWKWIKTNLCKAWVWITKGC